MDKANAIEHALKFHEDITITQWWRDLLGEGEFARFDPEDLLRWYREFELRGADELRALLVERTGRRPLSVVYGISWEIPHPPRAIVELWIEQFEDRRSKAPLWYGLAAVCLVGMFCGSMLSSCVSNSNLNLNTTPIAAAPSGQPPPAAATPAFTATPATPGMLLQGAPPPAIGTPPVTSTAPAGAPPTPSPTQPGGSAAPQTSTGGSP